jgi:hypothetical protein
MDPFLVHPSPSGAKRALFENAWYRAEITEEGELAFFVAGRPMTLIRRLRIVTDLRATTRETEVAVLLLSQCAHATEGETLVSLRAASKDIFTDIEMRMNHDSPDLQITCRSQSNRGYDLEVFQHSLVFDIAPRLTELFLKTRRSTQLFMRDRYWLDKQGARFGTGAQSVWIYHQPGVSSLEVDVVANRLIANLDRAADHPMLVDASDGRYRDVSACVLRSPRVLETWLTLSLGHAPRDTPRLLMQPHGRVATHVWTEHACFTDLRVHKAVYFGSDRIERSADATGGFVKHRIPVTKSIFFDNPDGVANDGHSPLFTGPQASLQTTPGMSEYLREIAAAGMEICLHCVQPNTSTEPAVGQAVEAMRKLFQPVSWIDHFWYHPFGEKRGCAESFCCRGQLSFSRSIWKRAGIRYFWNPFYEYETITEARTRREELNHWHWDQAAPNPIIWRHPTFANDRVVVSHRNSDFASFATWEAWFPKSSSQRYTDQSIDTLVADWGVSIAHAYMTFVGEENLAWRLAPDDSIEIGPEFDGLLAHMSALQSDGLLWNATLKEFMRYQEQLEDLHLSPRPQANGVALVNGAAAPVSGVTFAMTSSSVSIDGRRVNGRANQNDYIYTADVPASGEVLISPFHGEAENVG